MRELDGATSSSAQEITSSLPGTTENDAQQCQNVQNFPSEHSAVGLQQPFLS